MRTRAHVSAHVCLPAGMHAYLHACLPARAHATALVAETLTVKLRPDGRPVKLTSFGNGGVESDGQQPKPEGVTVLVDGDWAGDVET